MAGTLSDAHDPHSLSKDCMKTTPLRRRLTLALLSIAGLASSAGADETERFGRFGELTLYRNAPHPSQVVLFVSGDGGWNQGVVDMAKALASLDALVVGIDIRTYLAALRKSGDACLYPASDFEALSQYLQKKLDFPSYRIPVLIGYSSGATLVYATLAQAPANTFRGAISLGFCPDLAVSKALCKGSRGLTSKPNPKGNGITFDPVAATPAPWIAFQGTIDQVCDASATERYVSQVRGGEVVSLPKVGHGFSVQKNWMPQFRQSFTRLVGGASAQTAPVAERSPQTMVAPGANVPSVQDLPVVEVLATAGHSDRLAFIASGDGGWASLDKDVAGVLAAQGVPVVGLDTLQYYWQPRSPDESGRALERILRHYLAKWGKQRVLLVGYSRGADVLPFMATRLPADLADRVDLIALLGPEPQIAFEFHYTDWIGSAPKQNAHRVQPEVEKLRGRKLLCVYGADETDSICPKLTPGLARLDQRPGGHHFGGDYEAIARRILAEAAR
jgi:type IV secretory pathway VirJ component